MSVPVCLYVFATITFVQEEACDECPRVFVCVYKNYLCPGGGLPLHRTVDHVAELLSSWGRLGTRALAQRDDVVPAMGHLRVKVVIIMKTMAVKVVKMTGPTS